MKSVNLFAAFMGASSALAAPQALADTCAPITVTSTIYVSPASSTSAPPKVAPTLSTSTSAAAIPSASPSTDVSPPTGQKATSGYRNGLYFTNWGVYSAKTFPEDIPADKVTHVLYAFAIVNQAGEVVSPDSYSDVEMQMPNGKKIDWNSKVKTAYGAVGQLMDIKKKNRNLKILLSIGGWTNSQEGKFTLPASTDAGRKKFADSAVKLMADYGFDGLDIDWEYPTSKQEGQNYVLLLRACRMALDNYAKRNKQTYHYELTVACSAGPTTYNLWDFKGMDPYLDAWHLMTYDYAGSWGTATGHQANVYKDTKITAASPFDSDSAVKDYISRGINPKKIVFGLPLYGRSFANTQGLGKPFSGKGTGSVEPGIPLYKTLPLPGGRATFDQRTGATWSYDSAKKELVSFDGPKSANFKANYIINKGLGGSFFWEASGDKKGAQSLVGIMEKNYQGKLLGKPNMLSYPESQYDNIKNANKG